MPIAALTHHMLPGLLYDRAMTSLKYIFVIAAIAYLALLLLLYMGQRRMMYIPDRSAIPPAAAGFSDAREEKIKTPDGETVHIWYRPPKTGKPLILYFHGNAGQIAGRAERFRLLSNKGHGILALSYRGYGPSTGSPSEDGLITDARATYAFARANGHRPKDIFLFGESLGTGVAVALAAEKPVGGLILEAPYSSTLAVAQSTYWMFPVRALMKDHFRSDLKITKINAPLFVVHGNADPVMPIRFGKALFALAREPKTFVEIPGGGHQVIEQPDVLAKIQEWIEKNTSKAIR